MNSQARIRASRANGAKSRGPITTEGKAISSQNAIRHGLTSNSILIDGELPELFEELMAGFVAEFQPETDSELQLVESMAVCKWRQRRIWALENLGHCEAIRSLVANDPVIAAKGYPERAWYGFIELVQNSSAMMNLSRLEARFDRQYVRAQKLLLDKQARKE